MKILIVEDDRNLSRVIERCIRTSYECDLAFDGAEGYFLAQKNMYDLIVLDLMLPEMSGYAVLERLRSNDITTPVLILTALGSVEDKVKGFRFGADDYLTKPFSKEELLLRIQAILRRSLNLVDTQDIRFKDLVIRPDQRRAYINDQPLDLKGKQYDLLEYFVSRQGSLISKSQLFDKIWGFMSDTSTNVVEVYVSGLRKLLKEYGYDHYLQTIRGAGYLFAEPEHV